MRVFLHRLWLPGLGILLLVGCGKVNRIGEDASLPDGKMDQKLLDWSQPDLPAIDLPGPDKTLASDLPGPDKAMASDLPSPDKVLASDLPGLDKTLTLDILAPDAVPAKDLGVDVAGPGTLVLLSGSISSGGPLLAGTSGYLLLEGGFEGSEVLCHSGGNVCASGGIAP